jgi:hypothetical protein
MNTIDPGSKISQGWGSSKIAEKLAQNFDFAR